MTYAQYKRQLVLRNLAHNFKTNTEGFLKKATPVLKQLGENVNANANSLIDTPTKKGKKKAS